MEEAMGSLVGNRQKNGKNSLTPEVTRRELLALSALGLIAGAPGLAHAAGPQGQLTWGIHVSLAPTWFDPAETPGLITPFMIL
jgi:peptide/nickel transport system substrate-binding protein